MATDVQTDLKGTIDRLERMRNDGFFHQPRSLSELFCRLEDAGTSVELATLGFALSEMWQHDELLRTALSDGLLHYVDVSEAEVWRSIDGSSSHHDRRPDDAGKPVLH